MATRPIPGGFFAPPRLPVLERLPDNARRVQPEGAVELHRPVQVVDAQRQDAEACLDVDTPRTATPHAFAMGNGSTCMSPVRPMYWNCPMARC